jgi:AcrR family transcriptional regulator
MDEAERSRLYEAIMKRLPRQSRSRSVVEAILMSALDEVTRKRDVRALTVKDIAKRAGVGIASFYDYFRDREALLAGIAAKMTEDNLLALEATLELTKGMPARESIELIVDHAYDRIARDRELSRVLLRVSHQVGMMPAIARSMRVFTSALAKTLSERDDIKRVDLESTSYVLTSSLLGFLQVTIWDEEPPVPYEQLRATLVDTWVDILVKAS